MNQLAFFSGDGADRRAREWCAGRPRATFLDSNDFGHLVGGGGRDAAAAAAACAAAARALFAAGHDVAVSGEDYDIHWRHRLGPLMEQSGRAVRRIEGAGVALRAWEPDDVAWVHEACQDPLIGAWTNIPWPYREGDARALVELSERGRRMGTASLFAIVAPNGPVRLGSVALTFGPDATAEVGYWMAAAGRGRGAATAAVKLITAWALGELGLARVQLKTIVGNVASDRVAEKAGFEREGVLRAAQSDRSGGRVDLVSWSRTAPPAEAPAPDPAGTTRPGSA